MDETRADIAHLYRRLGFGATPERLDALVPGGYQAAVEGLVAPNASDVADSIPPPTFVPYVKPPANADAATRRMLRQQQNHEHAAIVTYWMQRLAKTSNPVREKMTLLWHGHFATSIEKVVLPQLMFDQNQIFRSKGMGNFEDLCLAVAKDPAMLVWLDANSNVKGHPNENFARELMELFTLGIGNYTETDVTEASRCFTGWTVHRETASFLFNPARHDAGSKTVLGATGTFTGEDVVHLTSSSAAAHQFVAAKLWSHLAFPVSTDHPVVHDLLGWNGDLRVLLRSIATHPSFRSTDARTGLVKQPIEWVVAALRALGVSYDEKFQAIFGQLSQIPFAPPSVGGWPQNVYWLTTATALARLNFANRIAALADLTVISNAPQSDRPAVLAHLLSLDGWAPATEAALQQAAGDPHALVALALTTPEFVLN